jgi:hypothetical protein
MFMGWRHFGQNQGVGPPRLRIHNSSQHSGERDRGQPSIVESQPLAVYASPAACIPLVAGREVIEAELVSGLCSFRLSPWANAANPSA